MSKKLFLFVAALAVFLIFVAREARYRWHLTLVPSESAEEVIFQVERGTPARKIAAELAMRGLVVSKSSFLRHLEEAGLVTKLHAGRHLLRRNATIPELAAALIAETPEEIRVRVPEGFTLKQLDAWLARRGIFAEGEILAVAAEKNFSRWREEFPFLPSLQEGIREPLEGWLFPETYFLSSADLSAEALLRRSLAEMGKRLAALGVSGEEARRAVILASLLEKETPAAAEKPLIAGILLARLAEGQRLGVDATTRYAVEKLSAALTKADLACDDPFNTRKVWGWPPGPIAFPSATSLSAAVNPEETPFRFYLHDAAGKIHLARTLAEHNANVARWLR